ncbi:MAG: hypothetical protein OEV80_12400, partial [candidate division Zixibacteria bacterium]|nr:hypothetical protein [candidate division Zixibacteria bacterium]
GDNNMILLDDANVHLFPSRVLEYPNLAVGEFGGDSFHRLGIHWKFGSTNPWVMATYFSTSAIGGPTGYYNSSPFGYFTEGLSSTDERIDLYYGRGNMIGGHNFGFHFGYSRASYDIDEANTDGDYQEKITYYDFGFGLTDTAGSYDASLHLGFGGWDDEGLDGAGDGVVQSEPDGFMDVTAMFRKFRQINPEWTAIGHATLFFGKRGEKDHGADAFGPDWTTTDDIITKDGRFFFDIGLGTNWMPAGNVLVVGDVGIAYDKVKREFTTSANHPAGAGSAEWTTTDVVFPYWSIGFDADVFKWMDVRMGATSDWISQKSETGSVIALTETEKTKWAENMTYLGFGFHWGRLHVDTETDPDLFLRGFDFITGNGGGSDMNGRISVVYELM